MRKATYIALFSALLVLVINLAASAFEEITPPEVKRKLDAGEDIFILDVRQPEEYAEGYVPTAYLIPLGEVGQRLDEIPRDKTVIVVCRSGGRSAKASQQLNDNGFGDVYNMTGGTLDWQAMPAYLSIKAEDLRDQLAELDAFILDVRAPKEYKTYHIQGAVSIPIDQLSDRRGEIPQGKGVIVVGTDDAQGTQVAEMLIEFGYLDVKSLEGGVLAWKHSTMRSIAKTLITTFGMIKILLSR